MTHTVSPSFSLFQYGKAALEKVPRTPSAHGTLSAFCLLWLSQLLRPP
jgi:hypothetical protein